MYTVWAHQSSCVSNVFEAIWRKFHMHFIIGGLFIGWTLLEMEDAVTEARLCMDSPYVMKQSIIPLSISTWFLKYRVSLDYFSISNSKKNRFLNKLDFLSTSNLIFTACIACKNQVRTRQKIEFASKTIFFRVCNKLPNWHFKNQAQIDTVTALYHILISGFRALPHKEQPKDEK